MYHILIHSSVNGNLDCFRVLAVGYSAAMDVEVYVFFLVMRLLFFLILFFNINVFILIGG